MSKNRILDNRQYNLEKLREKKRILDSNINELRKQITEKDDIYNKDKKLINQAIKKVTYASWTEKSITLLNDIIISSNLKKDFQTEDEYVEYLSEHVIFIIIESYSYRFDDSEFDDETDVMIVTMEAIFTAFKDLLFYEHSGRKLLLANGFRKVMDRYLLNVWYVIQNKSNSKVSIDYLLSLLNLDEETNYFALELYGTIIAELTDLSGSKNNAIEIFNKGPYEYYKFLNKSLSY